MTVSPNTGFKYSLGESPIVKVENIAPNGGRNDVYTRLYLLTTSKQATRHEIVKLFTALIGMVYVVHWDDVLILSRRRRAELH